MSLKEKIAGAKGTLVDLALDKALKLGGVAGDLLEDLFVLSRMVTAFWNGSYREFSPRTIGLALAALAYFVMPLDTIPDVLVAVGYLDDSAIFAATVAAIHSDVERFVSWEKSQSA